MVSLQIVAVWLTTTGSGFTVTVTVNGCPEQPLLPFGTIVYVTLTAIGVVLIQESSAISLAVKLFPVTGVPVKAVNPFEFIDVIW